MVSVKKFNEFLYEFFDNDIQKQKVQYCYFNGLLGELTAKAIYFEQTKAPKPKAAVEKLRMALESVGKNYFVAHRYDYSQFKQICTKAIREAGKELYKHRGWPEMLAKVLMGILSFGMIPLAFAIKSKVQTGVWNYRYLTSRVFSPVYN